MSRVDHISFSWFTYCFDFLDKLLPKQGGCEKSSGWMVHQAWCQNCMYVVLHHCQWSSSSIFLGSHMVYSGVVMPLWSLKSGGMNGLCSENCSEIMTLKINVALKNASPMLLKWLFSLSVSHQTSPNHFSHKMLQNIIIIFTYYQCCELCMYFVNCHYFSHPYVRFIMSSLIITSWIMFNYCLMYIPNGTKFTWIVIRNFYH